MNIAALLSGGVDSSVVVHLLCEQGYKPTFSHMKIGMDGAKYMDCSAKEDIELSTAIARRYGLELEAVDLHREYWDNVATYAIEKIRKGQTPDPDVMCNKLIKFGCFEQQIGRGFDLTAVGRYITTLQLGKKTWLGITEDPIKDQTDFLAQIDYLRVSKLLFPIGGLMKYEARGVALEAGLPSARREDSQGIRLLGKINYNNFVRRFLGEKGGAVIELETSKKVGTHHGYWFHTIDQRKGLGLRGDPWFAMKKDIQDNIIYVSHGHDTDKQYGYEFRMKDFNLIISNPWKDSTGEEDITFKIRRTPEFIEGRLIQDADGYQIISSEKLQRITPGQFGMIYSAGSRICLGGGEVG